MTLCILAILLGFVAGYITALSGFIRREQKKRKFNYLISNFEKSYTELEESGLSLMPFFENRNMTTIVVYGMGLYYNRFIGLIDENRLKIIYGDKNSDKSRGILAPEEIVNTEADVIIVTAVTYFDEIYSNLRKLGDNHPIYSFQELIYNAGRE